MERALLFSLLLVHLALDQASPLQELYVALMLDEHGCSFLQHYVHDAHESLVSPLFFFPLNL
jgi:hypothetical protein